MQLASRSIAACLAAAFIAGEAIGATYYVATNGHATYPGTLAQPWTIAKANATAAAGDTVYIRAGSYSTKLDPANDGNAISGPIVFAKYAPDAGAAVFTRTTTGFNCFLLASSSYIHLIGLECDGLAHGSGPTVTVSTGAHLTDGDHLRIENCLFQNITHTAINISDATDNVVINNTIEDVGVNGDNTGESIAIIDSSYNVIEGNTITRASHNLIQIYDSTDPGSSSHNLIKNNVLSNPWTRVGTVIGPHADWNVIEDNDIRDSATDEEEDDDKAWKAWKIAAPDNVFRRNLFYDNARYAIDIPAKAGAVQDDVSGNRIYHNVFWNNGTLQDEEDDEDGYPAISIFSDDDGATDVTDIQFVNNVIANNHVSSTLQIESDLDGGGFGGASGLFFSHNVIRDTSTGQDVAVDQDPAPDVLYSLADLETGFSSNFADNLEADPEFADPGTGDFSLEATSDLIDAGAFLSATTTTQASPSTTIPVADVTFFYCDDEHPLDGVDCDEIEIEGGGTARIVSIDEANSELEVDTGLTWTSGAGVSLAFDGDAPDVGAIEY
jgi:parallel beta-helix repeat protein